MSCRPAASSASVASPSMKCLSFLDLFFTSLSLSAYSLDIFSFSVGDLEFIYIYIFLNYKLMAFTQWF